MAAAPEVRPELEARRLMINTSRFFLAVAATSIQMIAAQGERVVHITPTSPNIPAEVAAAGEGTTFVFGPGVYRHLSITVKSHDTFEGMPGAIFDGSEPLHFYQKGKVWAAQANATQEAISPGVPCDPSLKNADGTKYTVGCTHSWSLYRNGIPLWRVATPAEIGAGKWFFDSTNKVVYLSDDPQGEMLELGETPDAFHGTGSAVTIRGLTIEKYAGAQQRGAINCDGGADWKIENNTVQLSHSAGIRFAGCDGIRVAGNTVIRNGNLGIGGTRAKNAIVDGNQIDSNNYTLVDAGWEAGGGKWTETTNLIVSDNKVHANLGPGLWSDIGAENTTYAGNTVTENTGPGILYEISRNARIEKNIAIGNGNNPLWVNPWLWNAQILISTSSNVVVQGNTVVVASHGNGITIVDQNRGSDANGERRGMDNRVIANDITYQSDLGGSGAASDREKPFQRNNVFDANTYHFLGPKGTSGHFYWAGLVTDWDGFRSAGNEKTGTAVVGK